ncbi:TonB-dependent receptor [candidate division GN15 bacterium]|nr:TonB-dependent receptor [candidate division GN15 bacterium]
MRQTAATALLSLCLLVGAIALPQAAEISGIVVDPNLKPIPSASIVTNIDGVGGRADESGRFSVTYNLPVEIDVERVTVSSVGYHSRVFLADNMPDTVVLEPRYYPTDDIIVTADRAETGETPVSFENVSQDELVRDYTVGDLPILLNTTPNFYSFSDGGGKMGYTYTQIRGFDDKRIAAYINGVPLNDPEDQYNYWVDLPDFTESVSDVQIQRGVGNSLYGDASFGGAINVVTNVFAQPRGTKITAGYGEYLSDGVSVGKTYKTSIEYTTGLIDGRWAFTGRFSKLRSDGYRINSWVDSWAYFFSLGRLDPNMSTELMVFGGPMRLRLTFLGIPKSTIESNRRFNPLTYPYETDNFSQPHYHLHNTWRLSDRATLENTVYLIQGDGYFEQQQLGASFADYNIDTSVTGGSETGNLVRQQSVDKWQLGWNPKLELKHRRGSHTLGGSFYYFESDHWGEVTHVEGLTGPLSSRHKYYQYYGKKLVGSLYGREVFHLADRLSTQATLQLRYQKYDFDQVRMGAFEGFQYDVTWFHVSPRIGFNYKLKDDPGALANIYTNFAVASRTPTDAAIYDASNPDVLPSLELLESPSMSGGSATQSADQSSGYVFGDPTFDAERVFNIEFGGNYRTPRWSVSANLYWMNFTDEIIDYGGINPSTGLVGTVNADGSYRAGIELSGTYKATPGLTLSGNLSLNRYRLKDFTDTLSVYYGSSDEIGELVVDLDNQHGLGFPEVLANLVADYKTGGLRLTGRLQGVGKQYMEVFNVDSLAIDPYTTVSVTAAYTLPNFLRLGHLTISATVDNLFDEKYETSGYGWNYGFANSPGDTPVVVSEAEYYVAAERSFYTELVWKLF